MNLKGEFSVCYSPTCTAFTVKCAKYYHQTNCQHILVPSTAFEWHVESLLEKRTTTFYRRSDEWKSRVWYRWSIIIIKKSSITRRKNKTTTPSFIFHGYVKKDFGSFSLAQSTSHSVTHNQWRWGIFTSLSPVCDPQYWWKHWIISFDVSFVGLGVVGKFSLKSSRMFQSWFIGLLADSRRKLPRTYWRIRSSLVHMCRLPAERRIDYGSHKAE